MENYPFALHRAVRLIAIGQIVSAFFENSSKRIQIHSYNDTDHDLACLVANAMGGSCALHALSRARLLPAEDMLREPFRLYPPLLPS